MRRLVRGALVLLVLAIAGGGLTALWAYNEFERPGPLGEETTVVFPNGVSLNEIAAQLAEAGVIERPLLFKLGVRVSGAARGLRAGEFAFAAGISARGVMEALVEGRTVVRRITVPEGWMTYQILELVAAADGLEGEVPDGFAEGALLPETYHFSLGESRAEVTGRMAAAMLDAVGELWPGRAEGLPFDTPEDAVILASIVEKETGFSGERAHIAGVFINRLRKGMRLQSDPTVIYAITKGQSQLDRPIRRSELERDDPYNTYVIYGLPPTPIANPGRAALEAVLNPLATKDLYFVADGSGGHVFARTLAEHNRNVAKWRQIEKALRDAGE
jgi:UPF0755 protein